MDFNSNTGSAGARGPKSQFEAAKVKPRPTSTSEYLRSQAYAQLEATVIASLNEQTRKLHGIRAAKGSSEDYTKEIKDFCAVRGRDLFLPFLSSGMGSGPYVELADGSVKLDLITGIGVNFFGHSHPELMRETLRGLAADPHQGNLQPATDARDFVDTLLQGVGSKSRLKHVWLTTCGTMANEIALKIIRQKKYPATKFIAFNDCFAGRSTAMQELTDNPSYRQGQPTYGEFFHVPFYQAKRGLDGSVQATLEAVRNIHHRYGEKLCGFVAELVQGEGGFYFAPREYYVRIFDEIKKLGLALWFDEIQTFGRTGELFAYQTLGLEEYPDVVTAAKMLQASVVLYSADYNPKPGLVAGTFAGGACTLRTGRRTLELLMHEGYLGPQGRINSLSTRFKEGLEGLMTGDCKGKIEEVRAIGGMIAVQPTPSSLERVKAIIMKLYEHGVITFYCGHGPYSIRLLPPLGVMTEDEVDLSVKLIGQAINEVGA